MSNPTCLSTNLSSNTAPGGWVEFQDWNASIYSEDESLEGSSIKLYYDIINAAYAKAGYTINPGPNLERWFREAGFIDVRVRKYLLPMGTWPKDEHLVREIRSLDSECCPITDTLDFIQSESTRSLEPLGSRQRFRSRCNGNLDEKRGLGKG